MVIIYTHNPLKSHVLLEDAEKSLLEERIRYDLLEERFILGSMYYAEENIEKTKEFLNLSYIDTTGDAVPPIDARTNLLFNEYLIELENGIHCGDCTCVASSCTKCHAESFLNIDTISGLSKHQACYIESAFREDDTTIDEAISSLELPFSNTKVGKYITEAVIQKWKSDRTHALLWLKEYKLKHKF